MVTLQQYVDMMCTDHAAAADRIVAQPGTITGSIGVIDGKLNLAPALRQLGIDVESVSEGKNALVDSWYNGFTRKQKRWSDSMLDRLVYHHHHLCAAC